MTQQQPQTKAVRSLPDIIINWNGDKLSIPVADKSVIRVLKPTYPPELRQSEIQAIVEQGINGIRDQVYSAKRVVLLLEDSSRATVTAGLVEIIMNRLLRIRGKKGGIDVVIAAGAHYNLAEKDLAKKVGTAAYEVHSAIDSEKLIEVGESKTGVPFVFNKKVIEADLRLSVSTVNIHPLAGYSGGGKILLPGVAGLKTIFAFHSLAPGVPGVYENAMRMLINEVTQVLPISFSWQLLANPHGQIVGIVGDQLFAAHHRAIALLERMVTVTPPPDPVDLIIAGCRPFNLNLLSTGKSLPQLPKLLRKGGRLALLNEAFQGPGGHYWRTEPEVVRRQKEYYQFLFRHHRVGIYSPNTKKEMFSSLFPVNFRLIENTTNLAAFVGSAKPLRILVLPYAPVTLIKPN